MTQAKHTAKFIGVIDASDDMDFGLVEQPQQPVERKKRSSLQEKKEEAELRLALELSMKDSRQSYQAPNNTVFNTKKFNCPEGLHGANVEDEAEEDVSPPHGSNGDACKRTHKEHYKAPAQAKFDQNGDVQSAPVPHGTIPGNSKSKGILGSAPSKERQQFRPDSPRSIPEATTALQPSSSASASKVSLFCINSLPLRIGLSRNARVKVSWHKNGRFKQND